MRRSSNWHVIYNPVVPTNSKLEPKRPSNICASRSNSSSIHKTVRGCGSHKQRSTSRTSINAVCSSPCLSSPVKSNCASCPSGNLTYFRRKCSLCVINNGTNIVKVSASCQCTACRACTWSKTGYSCTNNSCPQNGGIVVPTSNRIVPNIKYAIRAFWSAGYN